MREVVLLLTLLILSGCLVAVTAAFVATARTIRRTLRRVDGACDEAHELLHRANAGTRRIEETVQRACEVAQRVFHRFAFSNGARGSRRT